MLIVGVCRVELSIAGNDSLKGKRAILKRIIGRVSARFNVSIAEVDDNDEHESAVVGFAVVGNDKRFVNSVLDKIIDAIDACGEATLEHHEYQIESYG